MKMTTTSTFIEHIAWQVQDPLRIATWYMSLFGFTLCRRTGRNQTHFLADASGRVVLEIYHNPAVPVPDYATMDPLLMHLALAVEDPAAMRDRLVAAGATVVRDLAVNPDGDTVAMLRDPWGFPIQLVKRAQPILVPLRGKAARPASRVEGLQV